MIDRTRMPTRLTSLTDLRNAAACVLFSVGVVASGGEPASAAPRSTQDTNNIRLINVHWRTGKPAEPKIVQDIVALATRAIQDSTGGNDVACDVALAVNEAFTNENSQSTTIRESKDIWRLGDVHPYTSALPINVHIVAEIMGCRNKGDGAIGCAVIGRNVFAVVQSFADHRPILPRTQALLWAHEFGHVSGSLGREDKGYIMDERYYLRSGALSKIDCESMSAEAP